MTTNIFHFWKTRSIPFWMTANVRIPFSDDPILYDRKSIILGIFYDPFSDDDKCILFYKKRIIQFWMTANVFQFWKTRIIQFWMTANVFQFWKTRSIHFWMIIAEIPHYIEKYAKIIQTWMFFALVQLSSNFG